MPPAALGALGKERMGPSWEGSFPSAHPQVPPLRKQQTQGLGGGGGSPKAGKQDSVPTPPALASLFRTRPRPQPQTRSRPHASVPRRRCPHLRRWPKTRAAHTHCGSPGPPTCMWGGDGHLPGILQGSLVPDMRDELLSGGQAPGLHLSSSYWRRAGLEIVLSLPRPGSP